MKEVLGNPWLYCCLPCGVVYLISLIGIGYAGWKSSKEFNQRKAEEEKRLEPFAIYMQKIDEKLKR